MTAFARSALGLAVSGTFAVSAAFIAAPPTLLTQSATMPSLTLGSEAIALTVAFNPIEDQVAIISTYAQQAVDVTATWVSDVVTPLTTGQFWPLSGAPGNYIANAVNSTADFAAGLTSTVAGFVQAEVNYFGGIVPNLFDYVANAVQNIINWVTGLVPWPLAAKVSTAAATVAATATAPRTAAASSRANTSTAPARATTTAAPARAAATVKAPRPASATRQAAGSATPRGAAATRASARTAKPAAARAIR